MATPAGTFNGIQMGPHTILDEGIEHTLDLIGEAAGVNVVMPYSHAYNAGLVKALRDRADHGVPLVDNAGRRLPWLWVRTHEAFYQDTTLRHPARDPRDAHADRDLFAELIEPAHRRGMKVYARVLESAAMARVVTNYRTVVTRDVDGRPTNTACWNHPEYVAFWADTIEDLFRSYDLDGLQWGAERQGPLMNVISPWNNDPPSCFCEHCGARARAAGVDPDRAREGFRTLYTYVQGQIAGQPRPADGQFAGFARVVLKYPEILGWETQYRLGREAICDAMYRRAKAVRPAAEIGWHVDHQPSSWDLVYRAELSYADMAPHADFIKFIAYHNVLSPRIRDWYSAALREDHSWRAVARRVARSVLRAFRLRPGDRAGARRAGPARVFAGVRVPRDAAQRRERGRQDEDLHGHRLQRARQPAGRPRGDRASHPPRVRRRRARHRDLARVPRR